MSGISSAVRSQTMASYLPIAFSAQDYIVGGGCKFPRSATDTELLTFTDRVLQSFRKVANQINRTKSLALEADFCQQELIQLAKEGKTAYRRFFKDKEARQIIADRCTMMGTEIPAPTFISEQVLFPWEALYCGEDYHDGDPDCFWGLRYTPARILTPHIDISRYLTDRTDPLDMLFCLHQQLRQAHQTEWPEIERLILKLRSNRCRLLAAADSLTEIEDGETLLQYLITANHNIVHFACHCQPNDTNFSILRLSLLQENDCNSKARDLDLGTQDFILVEDQPFQRQPLIFLNACQSAGGGDDLSTTFNLPQMFIEQGAAAVIATACPVPDRFAAAFAKQFYSLFLPGQRTIGQALQATRWHFLKQYNNPLGLAYGLYSPPYYRLVQPFAPRGTDRGAV